MMLSLDHGFCLWSFSFGPIFPFFGHTNHAILELQIPRKWTETKSSLSVGDRCWAELTWFHVQWGFFPGVILKCKKQGKVLEKEIKLRTLDDTIRSFFNVIDLLLEILDSKIYTSCIFIPTTFVRQNFWNFYFYGSPFSLPLDLVFQRFLGNPQTSPQNKETPEISWKNNIELRISLVVTHHLEVLSDLGIRSMAKLSLFWWNFWSDETPGRFSPVSLRFAWSQKHL